MLLGIEKRSRKDNERYDGDKQEELIPTSPPHSKRIDPTL